MLKAATSQVVQPSSLSQSHAHIYTHTHRSNYGNQQADPISVSCLLSPGGWLPDHLTLHNLICNDRVWHLDFWPYQQLVCMCVCVCVYVHVCLSWCVCMRPSPCVVTISIHQIAPRQSQPQPGLWALDPGEEHSIWVWFRSCCGFLRCLSYLKADGQLC